MTEPDPRPAGGPLRRLLGSLAGVLATIIEIGQTRLELLSVEVREEINRAAALAVWGAVVVLAAGMGILLAGLTVIFAFWDSHRVLAAVLVTSVFLLLALGAGLYLRYQLRSRPPFLGATLDELRRDQAQLAGASRERDAP
ncbi:MAG: phage holin family protein [Gammaproteobacteria bacterium]|nr:phage holin family protein [Gammaproteobacteria bacterium]